MSSTDNDTTTFMQTLDVTITIGVLTSLLAVVTTAFNLLTLLAFCLSKSLRNFGDYFILNLAIADLAIGAFSIPPYIPYLLSGQWSAGKPFCLYWLLWDYVTPAASTFNVCVISIDRYLMVAQPIVYRAHQSKRLLLATMLAPWLVVTAVYAPSILLWEVITGETTIQEGECHVPYAHSVPFLLFGSFVEFMLPFSMMLVINLLVFLNIRKRSRNKVGDSELDKNHRGPVQTSPLVLFTTQVAPLHTPSSPTSAPRKGCRLCVKPEVAVKRGHGQVVETTDRPEAAAASGSEREKELPSISGSTLSCSSFGPDHRKSSGFTAKASGGSPPLRDPENSAVVTPPLEAVIPVTEASAFLSVPAARRVPITPEEEPPMYSLPLGKTSAPGVKAGAKSQSASAQTVVRYRRDRKAARSLFILVLVFAVCWLPYEVCAFIAAVCEDCIHPVVFETSFWLLWINSTVNPVLYPLLHTRFRAAFFVLWRRICCS